MALSELERQHIETSLKQAYELKSKLERRLMLAAQDPVEEANYKLDLEQVKERIATLEAELEQAQAPAATTTPPAVPAPVASQVSIADLMDKLEEAEQTKDWAKI